MKTEPHYKVTKGFLLMMQSDPLSWEGKKRNPHLAFLHREVKGHPDEAATLKLFGILGFANGHFSGGRGST